MRITNIRDLNEIKELALSKMSARINSDKSTSMESYQSAINRDVALCSNSNCPSNNREKIAEVMIEEIKALNLENKIRIIDVGCIGLCAKGPVAAIYPDQIFYKNITESGARLIVKNHLAKGLLVSEFTHWENNRSIPKMTDIPFFALQKRIALNRCGRIDPASIEEHIVLNGHQTMAKVLSSMTPEDVCSEIDDSHLRGRDRIGEYVADKWRACRKSIAEQRYLICCGDRGSSGLSAVRTLLEGDPFAFLEGMTLCGYASGATKGLLYLGSELSETNQKLSKTIKTAKEAGLLGTGILGTSFNFDIEIIQGSGRSIYGREIDLLEAIEGNQSGTKIRSLSPTIDGLWGSPACIQDVETVTTIPWILTNGANAFKKIGSKESKGTKILAIKGEIANQGVVEVELGSSLRSLIFDMGGKKVLNDQSFKAAQWSGPFGPCTSSNHLDLPIAYESLNELGPIMASDDLTILTPETCLVGVAKSFLEFVQGASCGRCPPCRIGTMRMLEALNRILENNGTEDDLDKLLDLSPKITDTALCALGKTASELVLSSIRNFRKDYESHISGSGTCSTN